MSVCVLLFVWLSLRMFFSVWLSLFHHFSSSIHEIPLSIIFQLFYLPMINSFEDADAFGVAVFVVVCHSSFSDALNLLSPCHTHFSFFYYFIT